MQQGADRHLLVAYKVIQNLHAKMKKKFQTNKHSMIIQQLQSSVKVKSVLYQSFDTFLSEHEQNESTAEHNNKRTIIKTRNELRSNIKNGEFDKVDLS